MEWVKLKNICNFMTQTCVFFLKKKHDSGHRPYREKKADIFTNLKDIWETTTKEWLKKII
jgi:hypothetical protein